MAILYGKESRGRPGATYKNPASIAIVGAGAAGICACKYLKDIGAAVTVFESGSYIGGMWVYENDSGTSSAYRTLHINSAKNLTAFSDYPFPDHVQTFPDHWDMHEYLDAYAREFGVWEKVRFNSKVTAIRPVFDPSREKPRWEVSLSSGECYEFDAVICATGHLTEPLHVDEFRSKFGGEYLHSHHYREPGPYVGKRVCVVGVGNSAVDIASDVCVNSPRTVLVARSGVLIAPKLIGGVPVTDITMKLYRPWIPEAIRSRISQFIVWLAHGRMTDYGFKPLTKKVHPTTSATVITHIAYNRITVKQGIERVEGSDIHFSDGTSETFDVLIAATGYRIDLPFFTPDVVPVVDNRVDLYKRIVSPRWPGLWFVGMVNSTTALNQVFERQAIWLREFIAGTALLPSADEMVADIGAKKRYIADHFVDSPRHTLEEEHLRYFRELKSSMRAGRRRSRIPRQFERKQALRD